VAAGAGGTGTHLASLQSVGDMRRRSGRKDRKERVDIVEMARRVRNWGICKPQRASHSAWKWGFKYARPPAGPAGYHNQALCSICLQNDLGAATIKMGADKSPTALVNHLQRHPDNSEEARRPRCVHSSLQVLKTPVWWPKRCICMIVSVICYRCLILCGVGDSLQF
jgi:hypothetical protein